MKYRILILIIPLLMILNFNCNRQRGIPYRYYFIPDSLRLPYKTGDTVIFRSVNTDTAIYDTFLIEKKVKKYIRSGYLYELDSWVGDYADCEKIYLTYFNLNNKITLIEMSSDILDIEMYSQKDSCECRIIFAENPDYSLINNLELNGNVYKNVIYNKQCGDCFYEIYRNVYNGLISYKTKDSIVFNFYQYKPFECGISK